MRINEIRPTLSGDVPRGYAFSSITSLTCTHFDPTIFLNFRKNVVVSHRVNEPIYLVHGTSFRVRPEKGNTGGHGASQRQASGGGFTYRYEYRPDGKLLRKESGGRTILACTYYRDGSLKTMTDVTGKTVTYGYGCDGKLLSIRDEAGEEIAGYREV